jgi:16S rRNA (adenine1518-N6/adenine1519-N6)-dimethyltransferase
VARKGRTEARGSTEGSRDQAPGALLARYGLAAKKSWSQNFLADARVRERIAVACALEPGDAVVEIGAGLGDLTAELVARASRVVAIERDRDLARVLRDRFAGSPAVEVAEANALTYDYAALAARVGRKPVVVGNLPYHLSSQILVRLLDERAHLERLVLMFQRELARRIAARPGGRDYGGLSVLARVHAEIRVVAEVPPGAFHPQPKVQSTVLRFDLRDAPSADFGDEAVFRRVVRAAFSRRRKTVRNALSGGLQVPGEALDALLRAAGIDPGARAESLPVEAFAALSRALSAASGWRAGGPS